MIIKAGRQLINATRYSLGGLSVLVKNEMASRLEIYGFFWVAVLFFVLGEPGSTFLVLVSFFGVLFAVEALNTAIEAIVDHVSPQFSEAAKQAKDLGSFAVMCIIIISAIYIGSVLYTANWNNFFEFIASPFGETILTILLMVIAFYFTLRSKFRARSLTVLLAILFTVLGIGLITYNASNYFIRNGFDESVISHILSGLEGRGLTNYYGLIFCIILSLFVLGSITFVMIDCFGDRKLKISRTLHDIVMWNVETSEPSHDQKRFKSVNMTAGMLALFLAIFINPMASNVVNLVKQAFGPTVG